jgi:branched-chain amino acid transport system substrate-binding protein
MRPPRRLQRTVLLLALVLLAGCFRGGGPASAGPLRIGALYPLTGPQGPYGTDESRGVQIALDLFNARGGLNGRQVQLDLVDAPDVDVAWREAHRMVAAKVPAIIGTYGSTLSIAASEVAHRAGVVYWETGAVADMVTSRRYPEIFRMGPSGATLAAQASAFSVDVVAPHYKIAVKDLRLAVVYENDPYGASVGAGIKHEAAVRGFRLVGSYGYNPATEDFATIMPALAKARPDIVVAASYLNDGAKFRTAVLRAKLPLKALIGKCAAFFTQAMADLLGSKINGVFVSDKPMEVSPKALLPEGAALEQELRTRFFASYGKQPTAMAYMGFSGGWAFLDALSRASSPTASAIEQAALRLDLPAGSLPNGAGVRFAPPSAAMAGQNLRALGVVWQWQSGRPVLVYPPIAARGVPVFGSS